VWVVKKEEARELHLSERVPYRESREWYEPRRSRWSTSDQQVTTA